MRSKRVRVSHYIPQKYLLQQENIEAFITHGGWGSVTESATSGKPLIIIPIKYDQHLNCLFVHNNYLGHCIKTFDIFT